jgi:hypothetical protein
MSGDLTAVVGQCHVIERWWCSALGTIGRCHMRPLQVVRQAPWWDDACLVLFYCRGVLLAGVAERGLVPLLWEDCCELHAGDSE